MQLVRMNDKIHANFSSLVSTVAFHVTERVRSVLRTGEDESGSRDEALLWPLAEREQFCLFARVVFNHC